MVAIFGYFADKSPSRQGPFIIGLLALAGSTVMFWVATTITALVIARVLQGLSAAVVWTVGMALVVDTVGQEQVGAAMGFVSMAMTVGTVFGPFIGGVVYVLSLFPLTLLSRCLWAELLTLANWVMYRLSRLGYHAVFVIAIALIALDIVLRLVMIEQKTAAKWVYARNADETEGLLGHGETHYGALEEEQNDPLSDDESTDGGESGSVSSAGRRTSSMPAIVRLLCSGNMLIALAATLVDAMIWASFDTVCSLGHCPIPLGAY